MKDWVINKILTLECVFKEFRIIEYLTWLSFVLISVITIMYQPFLMKLYNLEIMNQYIFRELIATHIHILYWGQMLVPLFLTLLAYTIISDKYDVLHKKKYGYC